MAYAVTQRTREIGLRMALGAGRRDVVGSLLHQGMLLVAVGSAIGLVGALALSRFIETLLFEVSAVDPLTFVGVVLAIVTVALVATLVPALRASKVDPMIALRYE
jgi:putative ABC transport system permease protein